MDRPRVVLILAVIITASLLVASDRVKVHHCREAEPPLWIDITGCNSTECIVYDQKFVKMTGELLAIDNAKYLHMEIAAHVWGFRLSYRIPHHKFDACTLLVKGCPLRKGEKYGILAAGIATLPFTGVQRMLEVTLHNENNVKMLCGKSTLRFEKRKNSLNKK